MQILKKFKGTAGLTVALLGLGLVGCAHHPERTASGYWNDRMTTRRVESALKSAPIYKFPTVNVTTFDGIVSLGGFVNTEGQKKEATDITRNVAGVREVIDNLVLKTQPTGRAPLVEKPRQVNPQQLAPRENPNDNQNPAPSNTNP